MVRAIRDDECDQLCCLPIREFLDIEMLGQLERVVDLLHLGLTGHGQGDLAGRITLGQPGPVTENLLQLAFELGAVADLDQSAFQELVQSGRAGAAYAGRESIVGLRPDTLGECFFGGLGERAAAAAAAGDAYLLAAVALVDAGGRHAVSPEAAIGIFLADLGREVAAHVNRHLAAGRNGGQQLAGLGFLAGMRPPPCACPVDSHCLAPGDHFAPPQGPGRRLS